MFSSLSNIDSARARAKLGFPDAGRPEENEGTDRPLRVLQPGAGTDDRVGHRLHRLVLADDPLVQDGVEPQQLFLLALHQPRHRHAGPARHHLGDLVGRHFLLHQARAAPAVDFFLSLLQRLFLLGQDAVLQLGGAVEVVGPLGLLDLVADLLELLAQLAGRLDGRLLALPLGLEPVPLRLHVGDLLFQIGQPLLRGGIFLLLERLALDGELGDAPLEVLQLLRHALVLGPQLRRRLVHEIDRLVGQERSVM